MGQFPSELPSIQLSRIGLRLQNPKHLASYKLENLSRKFMQACQIQLREKLRNPNNRVQFQTELSNRFSRLRSTHQLMI